MSKHTGRASSAQEIHTSRTIEDSATGITASTLSVRGEVVGPVSLCGASWCVFLPFSSAFQSFSRSSESNNHNTIMQKDSEETASTAEPVPSDDSSNPPAEPHGTTMAVGEEQESHDMALEEASVDTTSSSALNIGAGEGSAAAVAAVDGTVSMPSTGEVHGERSEFTHILSATTPSTSVDDMVVATSDKSSPVGVEMWKGNKKERTETESTVDQNSDVDPDDYFEYSTPTPFSKRWTRCVNGFAAPIKFCLLVLSGFAARNPKQYVLGIIALSIAVVTIGYQTNFYIEADESALWRPIGSLAERHGNFVEAVWNTDDDFWANWVPPEGPEVYPGAQWDGKQFVNIIIHRDGDNVVTLDGASRLFEVMDTVKNTSLYEDYCQRWGSEPACPKGYEFACAVYDIPYVDEELEAIKSCEIRGPTQLFLHDSHVFSQRAATEEELRASLTIDVFPGDYNRFELKNIIAYPERDQNNTLTSGVSYMTVFVIDPGRGAKILTRSVTNRLLDLRDEWLEDESNPFRMEILTTTSFPDEFNRGIVKDIPLIPLVFVIMSIFTMVVFSKRDWIKSRALLGFGAVACVSLSIMTGYGLLFWVGIPFTSLTQILPFIMFGIGLDDAFIIVNAYDRTDSKKAPVDRVHDTMEEVGMSIFMTTATSVLAFSLGCTSTLPAIRWLCLYAAPTIFVDFLFQITFFVALIVIDEQRMADGRRDCFVCYSANESSEDVQDEWLEEPREKKTEEPHQKNIAERFMIWYAERLLRRKVKAMVLWFFTSLFLILAYSASLLKVQFDFTSVLPSDSYVKDFNEAIADYAQIPSIEPRVYFHNVDQSDPLVQAQMESFVVDLVDQTDAITSPPFQFWLEDYKIFISKNETAADLSFNESIADFLAIPEYAIHEGNMRFDDDGYITISRVAVEMDNLDVDQVDSLLNGLRQQRKVSNEQPINQKSGMWSFFTFDSIYNLWEFLNVTSNELIMATVLGITSVSIMGMLFMPHWSGILFVAPMISVLYVDLLGFLQLCGITVNGVSFVAIVMSIGLLVDFVMHIQLSYYESTKLHRYYKTKDVLHTMGASVLLGGVSTFLGVMPLAFAANDIFYTIFVTFIGIVVLGISHGLVLLPVLLSIYGPH